MRAFVAVSVLTLALAACTSPAPQAPADTANAQTAKDSQADQAFDTVAKRWLDESMRLSPVWATGVGDHRFDEQLDDLSQVGRSRVLDFNKTLLRELDAIDTSALSRENQVDAAILRNQLRGEIWQAEVLQSWAWDPQMYSSLAGSAIYSLMAREFAPMPQRLRAATARMEKLPELFAQMRSNLDPARVPRIHAETVARQHAGINTLIAEFIQPNIGELSGEEQQRLNKAISNLQSAVAAHQTWLDDELVPNAKGDYRIGAKLYDEKLQFSLNSALSREEIGQRSRDELTRIRERMYVIATQVLKDEHVAPPLPDNPTPEQQQRAIETALELAYIERPERDGVVDYAKKTLDIATEFARKHDLVTVPTTPVQIILMPEFQRGVAVAYCDSPGPLERGLPTYYAISPIPDEWTNEQSESFLREYNNRMIHLLSIHEGVPGHYLEGAHSVKHPSTLRAVLRSGPFAEGWAVYTEKVMTDAGYLDRDPLFELVQLKFYARAVANAILDQGVHVDGMSRDEAMDLMVRQSFQQESEAAGKWIRAQLTSAQLATYFVGAQEHFDMRQAVEAKRGTEFNLKAYHDEVLAQGAPPVRFARQLILGEAIQ